MRSPSDLTYLALFSFRSSIEKQVTPVSDLRHNEDFLFFLPLPI